MEAVARRNRLQLILRPVTPQGQTRLTSHFLRVLDEERLVLSPPVDSTGAKVFLPVGWSLGLHFGLGPLWFQAASEVLAQGPVALGGPHCVDALVIRTPARLSSRTGRNEPRVPLLESRALSASLWPLRDVLQERLEAAFAGRVMDVSEHGLGIRLSEPCPLEVGQWAAIRLDLADQPEQSLWRGLLKHVTPQGPGQWLAGFSDVAELSPGELPILAEQLAQLPGQANQPKRGR